MLWRGHDYHLGAISSHSDGHARCIGPKRLQRSGNELRERWRGQLDRAFFMPSSREPVTRKKRGSEKPRMTETQSQLPFLMTAAEISARIKKINARTLKRARERGDIKGYLDGGKWVFEVCLRY